MVPHALVLPMVALATVATIVASQALITGVFCDGASSRAARLLPRVTVVHTSKDMEGRIYIPQANFLLMVLCITLVLTFKSSTALASAYGIAVTGTMAITSVLFYVVARGRWNWSLAHVLPITTVFLIIDLTLFSANVIKIENGGWVPIVIGMRSVHVWNEHLEERTQPSQPCAALRCVAARSLPR